MKRVTPPHLLEVIMVVSSIMLHENPFAMIMVSNITFRLLEDHNKMVYWKGKIEIFTELLGLCRIKMIC